jgi:hypothetical protein
MKKFFGKKNMRFIFFHKSFWFIVSCLHPRGVGMASGDKGKFPFKRTRFMGIDFLKITHLNMHGKPMVLGC